MAATTSPAFEALVKATAGAGSGAFSALALHPIEVVKTRIQTGGAGASPKATLKALLLEGGLRALYRGAAAKCIEDALEGFIFFYLYDAFIKLAKRQGKIRPWKNLVVGFCAGVITTTCVMPLEVIGTRLQAGAPGEVSGSIPSMIAQIVREEGVTGLLKGFWLNFVLCLNPAVQNTTFDRARIILLRRKARSGGSSTATLMPFEAFLLGAASKAMAIIVCYPLMRFKTLVQAGAFQIEDGKGKDTLVHISQFYRGIGSALAKNVLGGALMYMSKDQIVNSITSLLHNIAASQANRKSLSS